MAEADDQDAATLELSPQQIMDVVQSALATGAAAIEQGDMDGAEQVFRSILEIDPGNADACNGLAVAFSGKGDLTGAERFLKRAVELDSGNSQYHRNLGFVYAGRNRLKRAGRALAEAVRLDPADVEAHYRLAWVQRARGDMPGFIEHLQVIISIDADHALANNDLGCYMAQQGDLDQAQVYLRQGVAAEPENPSFLTNLANTQMIAGDIVEARQTFGEAVRKGPDFVEAMKGLATAERLLGNIGDALIASEKALALTPDDATALNLSGTVYKELGRYDDALAHFEKACSLADGFAPARSNAAMIKLLRGDWENGFHDYEARRFDPNVVTPRTDVASPQWDGSDLDGRAVLVLSEQGFGDTIQFCRLLKQLSETAGRIVVEVQPSIRQLLATLDADIEMIDVGDVPGAVEVVAPMMSLPYFLGVTAEAHISGAAYLHPGELKPEVAALMPAGEGLKIGLNWCGSPTHKEDWKRSVDPSVLAPLKELDGVQIFNLDIGDDSDAPEGLIDVREHIKDFADTAAIMANLDLIVSVDTATVHLAGALGRPCWALLPFVPDWRWMLDRADTPWYDSVALYRQPTMGDWGTVIAKVCDDIKLLRDGA
ncbi:MAG: tetratricopeptide repeat protein [Rhodospirillaceae bacterium]|jgi:Flp pilus assembly protein TadD|nr:tetratricopeptide repeat protein [Rhodospirillaceae bacterium]